MPSRCSARQAEEHSTTTAYRSIWVLTLPDMDVDTSPDHTDEGEPPCCWAVHASRATAAVGSAMHGSTLERLHHSNRTALSQSRLHESACNASVMAPSRSRSRSTGAVTYSLAALLLFMHIVVVHAQELTPSSTSELIARADTTKRAVRTQYICHWADTIETTKTSPMVLVIGLSIGSVAGIIIAG